MQICRLHHQRQANHVHTETHALLQKKDCLGDSEPQTVVISVRGLWTLIVSLERWEVLAMAELNSRIHSQWSCSGKDMQTSWGHREPALLPFISSCQSKPSAATSPASQYSTPLYCLCGAAEHQHSRWTTHCWFCNAQQKTVLTLKPYSELQCLDAVIQTCFCLYREKSALWCIICLTKVIVHFGVSVIL